MPEMLGVAGDVRGRSGVVDNGVENGKPVSCSLGPSPLPVWP